MKTTDQIEAVLNSWWEAEPFGFDHPETKSGILNLMNTIYTQAQNDMLAEASEGFEEWKDGNLTVVDGAIKVFAKTMSGIRNIGVSIDTFESCYKDARLSMMKENEEMEKRLTDSGKDSILMYDKNEKLQKENEELRTNFHHFMDKVQYVMPHKIEPEGCCSGRDCACMGKPINPEYYVQQLKEEYSAKWSLDKEGGK